MRTRTNGEVRERLRQLVVQHARRLGLGPGAADLLTRAAMLERWGVREVIHDAAGVEAAARLVIAGTVTLVCTPPRGKPVGVAVVPPGRFLPATAWPGASVLPLQAIVRDRLGTIVATWSADALDAVLATMPGAAVRPFVAEMVGDAGRAVEACRLLGLGLRDRVLSVLTTLARDFGVRHPAGVLIDLRLTHAELAALAGGSRANVTRALDDLRTSALVLVDDLRFVVTAHGLAAFTPPPAPSALRACG